MADFGFRVKHQDNRTRARAGVIHTPHGEIETPAFVPVGTQGSVKSLTPDELDALGVQLFFVNTYHMYLRPGIEVIKKVGGLHRFMSWDKPLITDSGGFQVFSLGRRDGDSLVNISDDGVEFRSHWDGSKHVFTPTSSMTWQWELGADIHIAFDDCTPYPVSIEKARISLDRTHRWAKESLRAHRALAKQYQKNKKPYQALYGSIQGSVFQELREESARFIGTMDFDGIAIGGVAVGESKKEMAMVLGWVIPFLPKEKPRHLLGVGEIDDIFTLVEHGVDTFDCVQPTRLGRVGLLLVGNNPIIQSTNNPIKKHQLDITKTAYAKDASPVDSACCCYTCLRFSRAYLHHLFRVKELLAYRLATIHNLHFVMALVSDIRKSIREGSFLDLARQWR